jgi:hypothetical protein
VFSSKVGLCLTKRKRKKKNHKIIIFQKIIIKIKEKRIIKGRNIINWGKESKRRKRKMV